MQWIKSESAISLIGTPRTPSGDPKRPCQKYLKNVWDDANNKSFVQPGAWALNFRRDETCVVNP